MMIHRSAFVILLGIYTLSASYRPWLASACLAGMAGILIARIDVPRKDSDE